MSESLRPIYRALPGLEPHLPCAHFAVLPSPVQRWEMDGRPVWIKRDDLTHPVYGGNKVRKLEFILAAARAAGQTRVVTFGATGTHHGLATAIFCRQLGLQCEVLLFDQPETAHVRENLQRLADEGAQRVFCGSLANCLRRFYLHPARLRRDTVFLFAGGSNPVGTLAFVDAALELKAQVEAGELAAPQRIYCPLGSGSTLAGLTLGVALANLPTRVVGVRVADAKLGPFDACSEKTVEALMHKTVDWLRARQVIWPARIPSPKLDERWIGPGYGHSTPAAQEAALRFESVVGVPLDLTYTAKAFAAVLADEQADQVLYWHTLSSALPKSAG